MTHISTRGIETGHYPLHPRAFPRGKEEPVQIGIVLTRAEIERNEWQDK